MCESVTSRKSPPLMFGAETSSTPPSQNTPSLISESKLLRNVSTAAAVCTCTLSRSTTLSLTPSWSGTNALFGGLSDEVVEVAKPTPSPGTGLDATHPAGNAGAVTPSKFSVHVPPPPGVGVGVPPPPGVGDGVGVPPPPGVGDGVGVQAAHGVAVAAAAGRS